MYHEVHKVRLDLDRMMMRVVNEQATGEDGILTMNKWRRRINTVFIS